jgi:hypothetical protein
MYDQPDPNGLTAPPPPTFRIEAKELIHDWEFVLFRTKTTSHTNVCENL